MTIDHREALTNSIGHAYFSVNQAKTHFSKILELLELNDEAIITRCGKPIARVIPYETSETKRVFRLVVYKLKFRKQPIKTIRRLSVPDALRVCNELSKLADNPDRQDIDVAKSKGRSGNRLRVGNWRINFERDEQNREIDVLRIGSGGAIYK